MKKRILIAICLVVTTSTSFSQMTKDSLIKTMAKEVCIELGKNSKDNKAESIEARLGMPFMLVFGKYAEDINSVYGFTEMNQSNGEKVGRDIGEKLSTDCPEFAKMIMNNTDEAKDLIAKDKKIRDTKITGVFLKLNSGEFSFIEVRTNTNKIEKLYWMEYFENANDLMNTPTKFINKKVIVNYIEKEIYKSSIKDYIKIKIITSLTID